MRRSLQLIIAAAQRARPSSAPVTARLELTLSPGVAVSPAGTISSQDFKLAAKFDADGNGTLRHALR